MTSLSFQERNSWWDHCEKDIYDIVVIGGGINGAGVARDAALRGLRVLNIEAKDFAYGTSSRSSKLVHGGIRYLENLEFKLVFEALSERGHLFKMAPHLVHPLRFFIPLYRKGRVGMFKLGLGMWLYDALSLFRAPQLHQRLSFAKAIEKFQPLKREDLLGGFEYSDAYMDDDRLVFETMRSAAAYGAQFINYCRALKTKTPSDSMGVTGLEIRNEITKECKWIKAHHIVSTVGPWSDDLGTSLFTEWKRILRPTKGVHLTFAKKDFPLPTAVVMAAESRIVFAIPRHEMVIVGTTDTDFKDSPDQVAVLPEDVSYLLNVIHSYFPGVQLQEKDILSAYAGVRPLVADGATSEGKTSREHVIFNWQSKYTFVAGGKYTTYRLIAEQTVDEVLSADPSLKKKCVQKSISTAPLNPLVDEITWKNNESYRHELSKKVSWPKEDLDRFIDRHGQEALQIFARYPESQKSVWALEAEHAIDHTMCLQLTDFYSRRVPLFLGEKDHGHSLLPILLEVFARRLHWTPERAEQEKQLLMREHTELLAWRSK